MECLLCSGINSKLLEGRDKGRFTYDIHSGFGRGVIQIYTKYRVVQKKKSCMFEFPTYLPPTNLGLPIHRPSALTEHVSLNLAGTFLLDPVYGMNSPSAGPRHNVFMG